MFLDFATFCDVFVPTKHEDIFTWHGICGLVHSYLCYLNGSTIQHSQVPKIEFFCWYLAPMRFPEGFPGPDLRAFKVSFLAGLDLSFR